VTALAGGPSAPARVDVYPMRAGDALTTEALVEAGRYGYAHSCVTSENFPCRAPGDAAREIALVTLGRAATAVEAIGEAAALGLAPPTYEDALRFGAAHPDAQHAGPIVFLHEPWVGFFGRRDVLCLWSNAGRRELGLEGFDERFGADVRFAFVRASPARAGEGARRA
jgi:hypothetical protein